MKIEEKLKAQAAAPPQISFRWRYVGTKIEGKYVSLTNLRLEACITGYDQVKLFHAAPTVIIVDGRPVVSLQSSDLLFITKGKRHGIVITADSIRDDEVGCVPKMVDEVDLEHSTEEQKKLMWDLCSADAYPGTDMRVPEMFRFSAHPENLKLAFSKKLQEAIKADPGNLEKYRQAFLSNLSYIAEQTSQGWIIPFEYVFAGGMVVAYGGSISRTSETCTYRRPYSMYETNRAIFCWKTPLLEQQ